MSVPHWESYWSERTNWDWWQIPAPEVLDLLRSISPDDYPRALDLGCGIGRHAIAMALAGHTVTAVDASAAAVERARAWAEDLELAMDARVGDYRRDPWPVATYDLVLSYNVIYHGLRCEMIRALAGIRQALRPGGLLFFTCPSRRDAKYGHGEQVAPHTYRSVLSVTPGDIHYFADRADLERMLVGFRLLDCRLDEGTWQNRGRDQVFANWQVRAERDDKLMQ